MSSYKERVGIPAAIILTLGFMATVSGCSTSREQRRTVTERQAVGLRLGAATEVATLDRSETEEVRIEPIAGDTAELWLSEGALLTLPEGAEYRRRGARVEVSVRREGGALRVEATADSVGRRTERRRIRDQTETRARADSVASTRIIRSEDQSEEIRGRSGRSGTLVTALAGALGALLLAEWLRERRRKKKQ